MRLDAWIMFGLWVIAVIGLIGTITKQDQEKREMQARHTKETAELHRQAEREQAKMSARFFHEQRIMEERHEEAAEAMKKEIDRLIMETKLKGEIIRKLQDMGKKEAS